MAAAPTPQRRAASSTAAAVALFDYGRLWGSFSKGSLKNEGGICSTVVKTVGSLQFCNERDAKAGKGSVLKFIYSEKATKLCEIFTLLLTGTT